VPVAQGQVLVRPTLAGDANLDGTVDFFDIAQLLGYSYNTGAAASYTDGDLDVSSWGPAHLPRSPVAPARPLPARCSPAL
jgi:hypothetical protein